MPNDSDLNLKIKKSIVRSLKLKIEPETIGDDDLLIGGGLNLDSVDLLTLVWVLEDEFKIKIRDDEVRTINSVSQIAAFIQSKSSGQ